MASIKTNKKPRENLNVLMELSAKSKQHVKFLKNFFLPLRSQFLSNFAEILAVNLCVLCGFNGAFRFELAAF